MPIREHYHAYGHAIPISTRRLTVGGGVDTRRRMLRLSPLAPTGEFDIMIRATAMLPPQRRALG